MALKISTPHHAFLGLSPTRGLIPAYRNFLAENKMPKNLKPQPWYKLHLTLLFWPQIFTEQLPWLIDALDELFRKMEVHLESSIKGFHFFVGPQVLYFRETNDSIIEFQKNAYNFMQKKTYDIPQVKREENFTPHWTIGRKFHTSMLKGNSGFFQNLDIFNVSGSIPSVCLYYSYKGRYEPLPIFPFPKKI